MTETTRALAQLPGLDVEIVHDRTPDGEAERLAIRLTGRPDLETAAKTLEPHLLRGLLATNPWLKLQAEMAQAFWGPVLRMNPLLRPLLPPPDRKGDG